MMVHMLVRMAFRAIRHHVIRSLLTLLGIVIGIAGIIAISAIGKGAEKKARDQWLAHGSKCVEIGGHNWMSTTTKPPKPLVLDDMDAILVQCPGVRYISPDQSAGEIALEYQGNKKTAHVVGGNHTLCFIEEYELEAGTFFSLEQVNRCENVVVLKADLAEALFGRSDPVGATIRIKQIPFMVVGVLAPPKIKRKFEGIGHSTAFIPFTTHQKYFGRRLYGFKMGTHTEEAVPEVARQLEKIFRAAHRHRSNCQTGAPDLRGPRVSAQSPALRGSEEVSGAVWRVNPKKS